MASWPSTSAEAPDSESRLRAFAGLGFKALGLFRRKGGGGRVFIRAFASWERLPHRGVRSLDGIKRSHAVSGK